MTTSVRTSAVHPLDGTRTLSRELVGGKAYSLNKMSALGMPVPPAFAITAEVCPAYHERGNSLPEKVWCDVLEQVAALERLTGHIFGGASSPLLVSVRSGAAVSMPGMMDTILNLGLNEEISESLASQTGDDRWSRESHERFRRSFTDIVGSEPPDDPIEQLRSAVGAVFESWFSARAVSYRDRHQITGLNGTAVTVQAMVFGNRDEQSGTGVAFSRDPLTGEHGVTGEWLSKAQGEDVVSGVGSPQEIAEFAKQQPNNHNALCEIADILERDAADMVDIEFTVESGTLYMLQARAGKRSASAAVRIAVDMVHEGLIDRPAALKRVTGDQARQLEHDAAGAARGTEIARGVAAGSGQATGVAVTDLDEALRRSDEGDQVVLVRSSTSPDDVPVMFGSVAVITEQGGSTSHAALVCREIGLPCVVGCGQGTLETLRGQTLTVDGSNGLVLRDAIAAEGVAAPNSHAEALRSWALEASDAHLNEATCEHTLADLLQRNPAGS